MRYFKILGFQDSLGGVGTMYLMKWFTGKTLKSRELHK